MKTWRVYFRRTVTQDLYIDVKARDRRDALDKANTATTDNDDALFEIPESYDYDVGPTGEVNEPPEE